MIDCDDRPAGGSDSASNDMIHAMVTAQKRQASRAALPEIAPAEPEMRPPDHQSSGPRPGRLRKVPARRPESPPSRRRTSLRPSHALLAGLAAVTLWRPWIVAAIIVLFVWLGLVIYLAVGPDQLSAWGRRAKRGIARVLPPRPKAVRPKAMIEKLRPARDETGLDDLPDPFERLKPLHATQD